MIKILDTLFGNWARFIFALLVARHISRNAPWELTIGIYLHSLAGFLAGFIFGWMVLRHFLGLKDWKLSLCGGLVLALYLAKTAKFAWFMPTAPEAKQIFDKALFSTLAHSSLALLYFILSRRTIKPTVRDPRGQKRLEK